MTPLKKAAAMKGMEGNEELAQLMKEEASMEPSIEHKGCTANVVLIVPRDAKNPQLIVCANAGDSRSVMGVQGKAFALS